MSINRSVGQNADRTAEEIQILMRMTQTQGIEAAEMITQKKGIETTVAGSNEVAVLIGKTDSKVRDIAIDRRIITSDTGLSYDGPCELLDNGERRPLYAGTWKTLSEKERDAVLDKSFYILAESKRAWENSGSGPVAVDFAFDKKGRHLVFDARRNLDESLGAVVLVSKHPQD